MTQSALPPDVRAALLRYRILANIVGVLLIPLVVFAWPRHLLYDEGSGIYQAGEWVNGCNEWQVTSIQCGLLVECE